MFQFEKRWGLKDEWGRAIAEPLLAHIRSIMGLDRFTLRTKKKVDVQWKLYSMSRLQKVPFCRQC